MEPTSLETSQPLNNAVENVAVGHSVHTSSVSFIDLFWNADWVVQSVMFILLAASVFCWAIIFSKLMRLRTLKASADKFEEAFWSGKPLDQLFERVSARPTHPLAVVFSTAMREWHRSSSKKRGAGSENYASLQQRIERVMQVAVTKEMESLESHMSFLASVGSTAPFVGLFGTVWGIMHSFQGIAASQSTNLAVVAPGIAEALFATALGLIAAIPAVLAYNKISTELDRYYSRLETFTQEFGAIISRQLDESDA